MKSSEFEPNLDETIAKLQSVLKGVASREDVSRWATQWIISEKNISNQRLWQLIKLLANIDSKTSPTEYLYVETDVQAWLKALVPTVTVQDLLGRGYFPRELTPPFTTLSLAEKTSAFIEDIESFQKNRKTSRICNHSIPKHKHQRRKLGIPNPLHQTILCGTIANYWSDIESYTKTSNISLSTPVPGRGRKSRAIRCKYNYFDDFHRERILRSVGLRYCLRTDFSRYYSTIYTHSIPWAIHNKTTAKRRKWDKTLLGNLLDECIRNSQDGQTMGIPIGPDSSLVIAEIIATSIDQELSQRVSDQLSGCRYVDDYYLYFKTAAEAELTISHLQGVLSEFELETNSAKTYIKELPEIIEEEWVSELRKYNISDGEISQRHDLIGYFSKTFHYASVYADSSVIKYALSKLIRNKDINILEKNWDIFESLVLQSAVADPGVLDLVTDILFSYMKKGYTLNSERVSKAILEILEHSIQLSHTNEIIWCLWLFKVLKIELNDNLIQKLVEISDPLVALTVLDLRDSGLTKKSFDTSLWTSLMTCDDLYSSHWLLAYEAEVKGWLNSSNGEDHIKQDPFFSALRDNEVSFYNSSLPLKTTHSTYSSKSRKADVLLPKTQDNGNDSNDDMDVEIDEDIYPTFSYFY